MLEKCFVKDYENYLIDTEGNVYNINTNKLLKGSIGEHGYKYYRLSKDGKKKMFYAHRLVAEAFLPNPNNFTIVNHIDGNKLNNNISNLRLLSLSENVQAAFYTQKTNQSCKTVLQFDLNGRFVAEFPSIKEAARQLNLDSSTISKVCRGQNKTHGGFIFKYKDN